jgi:hypothetical protein
MTQLELFERPKNLTGEEAWKLAKAVSTGAYPYSTAKEMVADVKQLDADLMYIEEIVQSHTY